MDSSELWHTPGLIGLPPDTAKWHFNRTTPLHSPSPTPVMPGKEEALAVRCRDATTAKAGCLAEKGDRTERPTFLNENARCCLVPSLAQALAKKATSQNACRSVQCLYKLDALPVVQRSLWSSLAPKHELHKPIVNSSILASLQSTWFSCRTTNTCKRNKA